MCGTWHSIADKVCSKTQLLLATLRTQTQPLVESCVFLEAEHLSRGDERPKITSLGKPSAAQPNHTSHQETGAVFDSKTKNPTFEKKKGVPIPSTVDLQDTSYVVISRETERLVNEIRDHKAKVRSSNELLGDLQESERKVTTSCKETWAA